MAKSSISRSKSGRNSKKIRPGATKASFPGSALTRTTEQEGDGRDSSQTKAPCPVSVAKSMRNKIAYQKKLNNKLSETNDSLKDNCLTKDQDISSLVLEGKKQKKVVSAAIKSAEKSRLTLETRTGRFEHHRKRKEDEILAVKRKAKAKVEVLEQTFICQKESQEKKIASVKRSHVKVISQLTSAAFKKSRKGDKRALELTDALHQQELKAAKCNLLLKEEHAQVVVGLVEEVDAAVRMKDVSIQNIEVTIKNAVKTAKNEERTFYATKLREQKKQSAKLITIIDTQKNLTAALTQSTISAQRHSERTTREANVSARRSRDVTEAVEKYKAGLEEALSKVKSLENTVEELQAMLEESGKQLQSAQSKVPITVMKKERIGKRGATRWPAFIWESIMEQLVNGTPPSSVNSNIITFVATMAPHIEIKELPSLWTIRRARTVLLVVVQTLAAYRLAKADRWGQIFSDETERRQDSFQDLIISIEDDELFR